MIYSHESHIALYPHPTDKTSFTKKQYPATISKTIIVATPPFFSILCKKQLYRGDIIITVMKQNQFKER